MPKRIVAIDPNVRESIASREVSGWADGESPSDLSFNQLAFIASGQDHVLGSASQLTGNTCTMKWNGTDYVDKSDVVVPFSNYDRIDIVGSDTLTANMDLPTIEGLKMRSVNGAELQLGVNAGDGNAPYKLIADNTTSYHDIDIKTDKPFEVISLALTPDQRRYFANQGLKNKISVNGVGIYDPTLAGSIVSLDSIPFDNPYLIRMNGQQLSYKLHGTPATNNTLAWFRDLNRKIGGLRDGSEFASRYTLTAIIGSSPHIFQVNTAYGVLRELNADDPDLHSRTDRNSISIPVTADFDGTSTVTFDTAIGNIKEGQRIQGAGLPSSADFTTILVNISGLTATMIDAETGLAVTVGSATGVAVTVDSSGAAGGSEQDDQAQGHMHNLIVYGPYNTTPNTGPNTMAIGSNNGVNGALLNNMATDWRIKLPSDDGVNGSTRTGTVNRDRSTGKLTYQHA